MQGLQHAGRRRVWHHSSNRSHSCLATMLQLACASVRSKQLQGRRWHSREAGLCRSGMDAPGSDPSEPQPDIDILAKMLSQKAAMMRASMSEEEIQAEMSAREQVVFQNVAPKLPGPKATEELEARVIAEVGEGGFTSDDFELVARLGSISVQQAVGGQSQAAVIAYIARYVARIAYSMPVNTMVKEYLPIAKAVACNELLLLQHLCGIPEDKYQAAVSRPEARGPPVVPLLGYFSSAPSEDASAELGPAGAAAVDDQESLWLVYKWEGLRPITLYMDAGPPEVKTSFLKRQEVAEAEAWSRRTDMLRAVAARLLAAIDFCHSADVVHGALSSGSVLMSSSVDCRPQDLVVKLDGFGFGKWYRAPIADSGQGGAAWPDLRSSQLSSLAGFGGLVALDGTLEEGKKADLQAAALLLAEMFAAGLASTPEGRLPAASLRKLLFDVFHENVTAFRDYCLQDESGHFSRLVAFLDEQDQAGWDFLRRLLSSQASALELSQHAFLRDKPSNSLL